MGNKKEMVRFCREFGFVGDVVFFSINNMKLKKCYSYQTYIIKYIFLIMNYY